MAKVEPSTAVRIPIAFDQETYDWLREQSYQRHPTSIAAIVREAVAEYRRRHRTAVSGEWNEPRGFAPLSDSKLRTQKPSRTVRDVIREQIGRDG